MEQTLVLLKPDAVGKNLIGEIITRFERKGLKVIGLKLMNLDTAILEDHYRAHKEKPFFPKLVSYMQSGPVVALGIEGFAAVTTVRQLCGATNPADALPGTIRGDFAKNIDNNIIHSSDSVEAGQEELARFFKKEEILSYTKTAFAE